MGLSVSQIQRDLNVLWHPCIQMKDHEHLPVIPVRHGESVWLGDFEGKRYIDVISPWQVNMFGHANPRINRRIKDQIGQLKHAILAGFSYQPVVELSEQLVKVTPPGFDQVFYVDSGSADIEVALKTSYHFWLDSGRPRKERFVTLTNNYHGKTIVAMPVDDAVLFTETYKSLLLDTIKMSSPDCFLRPDGMCWEEHSQNVFVHMERTLAGGHDEIATVIAEPLIQGVGNIHMYHPVHLKPSRKAYDRYGVHLVHDEIAADFGHTGTISTCEQAGIALDFLYLSKALTGGHLPTSAMLTSETIYRGFYDGHQTPRASFHSHTYTSNPLVYTAALTTLGIFEENKAVEANRALSIHMVRATARLADHPHAAEVCQAGMVPATEMVQDKAFRTPHPWQEYRGLKVFQHDLKRDALLHSLDSMVYFLSPYVITPEQIDFLVEVASEGVDVATHDAISMAVSDFHPDHRDPG